MNASMIGTVATPSVSPPSPTSDVALSKPVARKGPRRLTAPAVAERKSDERGLSQPLVMVTAYDAPSAKVAHRAGVDMILVGDSVAMVVLGYEDTLQVTVDDMARHTKAVARGLAASEADGCTNTRPLVVGDLPWMSYHVSTEDAVRNAAELMRSGAGCVKLEGGAKRIPMIKAIVDAEIPVMGHIGLTPQSVNALGGFKVQGKDAAAAKALIVAARALEDAGCFAIVLEAVPDAVGRAVTEAVSIPTIGIGAGAHCDGQVLVWHDLLGLEDRLAPKFVRRYAELGKAAEVAISAYAADVRSGSFPSSAESYAASEQLEEALADRPGLRSVPSMADFSIEDDLIALYA
jgi:3-methyl-2-oxobutanoate hydroxymethyltransferase